MKKKFQEEIFQHQSIIHKICRVYRDTKEDREDLFQEITYQLWKAYPKFEGKSKISTWMYRIGLNTAIATFRKQKVSLVELPAFEVPDDTNGEGDVRMDQLLWAIKQMNDQDRALITLYFDNLSHKQIGEIIGLKESHVNVRLYRIKEKIKKLLNIQK